MGKEDYFISGFSDATIGDDGSFIENSVYSKDLFCEDIHFKLSWMSLEAIAKKSMLVNISDAIAMNAFPKFALLGLVIPKDFSHTQLRALNQGFEQVAHEYGIRIIGGDTTAGKKLMISVSIISTCTKPLSRKGMKEGDFIAFTGNLGESRKGLKRLLNGGSLASSKRFVTPTLRGDFIYEVAPYLSAGLDISDGLSKDLWRLCRQSRNKSVKFFKKFTKEEFCSGEEYEMLFAFPKKYYAKIQNIAIKHKTPLTLVGKAIRGKYKSSCKENHF